MQYDVQHVLDGYWRKVRTAHNEHEINQVIVEMLEYCQAVIYSDASDIINIYCEVAYILKEHPGNITIWSWLNNNAKTASKSIREAMVIAIFESIPDDPVQLLDLFQLWDLSGDDKTMWAVELAYEKNPDRIAEHYRLYTEHCKRLGKTFPGREILSRKRVKP
jgi:hypothetical protein